jgi:glycosyltransferase involved in cell wall biosynthesis
MASASNTTVRLSIVTVTFNDPQGLSRTLLSLRELPGIDWELLLVDSSPEKNVPVIASIGAGLPITHLPRRATGIYPAMNEGLRAAQGEFIWFLNGGDCLTSASDLMEVLAFLQNDLGAATVIANAELVRDEKVLYTQRADISLRSVLGINRICHQAVVYRRNFFDRFGYYSETLKIAADYKLHLQALAAGATMISAPVSLVRYDMSGQSNHYRNALHEFGRVHAELRRAGQLPWSRLHSLVLAAEWLRISLFKKLGATTAGPVLRSAWLLFRSRGR